MKTYSIKYQFSQVGLITKFLNSMFLKLEFSIFLYFDDILIGIIQRFWFDVTSKAQGLLYAIINKNFARNNINFLPNSFG